MPVNVVFLCSFFCLFVFTLFSLSGSIFYMVHISFVWGVSAFCCIVACFCLVWYIYFGVLILDQDLAMCPIQLPTDRFYIFVKINFPDLQLLVTYSITIIFFM